MKFYLISIILLMTIFISGCTDININTENETNQLANPAAVLCQDKGHSYEIRTDKDQNQYGICTINGVECDAWDFYRGDCPTCEKWCPSQPHIMCVGNWNISGTYPKCNCMYTCVVE
ncbi:MAG: DUF333 domain-containing protein [DPANN group archaeon]|nr:DUF333 domain-containing protein [DPANN group archaeon]